MEDIGVIVTGPRAQEGRFSTFCLGRLNIGGTEHTADITINDIATTFNLHRTDNFKIRSFPEALDYFSSHINPIER